MRAVYLSYGVNFPTLYKRAAEFVDMIARGAKPADLPVEQPTKFELVLNLKTAKVIDVTISPAILVRSDEVSNSALFCCDAFGPKMACRRREAMSAIWLLLGVRRT